MTTNITCPKCGNEFQPSDAIRGEVEKQLRAQVQEWQKKKEAEFQKQLAQKDEEADKRLGEERKRLQEQLEGQIKKQLESDYETQMKFLEQRNEDNEKRLKEARDKELEFLKKEQQLADKEKDLEIQVQKTLNEEKMRLSERIQKEEEEKTFLKIKQLEKQLEDQKKIAEEAVRKAEQGSMQLQGEVQELALEEMLRNSFPIDTIEEVGKGVRGADCIQTVRNSVGQECGKIIFESKRTKEFSNDWVEKLKADMRSQGVDVAVIVTQAMPKGMDRFGEKDGIWVCSFFEVQPLVHVLRGSIMKVYNATKSQENKGDKMTLLYNYFTSSEFSEQWKAMREGFRGLKDSIQKERDQMERIWKAREKQLEKILLNASHIRGSIDGIAGADSIDMQLLGDNDMIE